MIFSEIYSVYYNTMAKLIDMAIINELNKKTATQTINYTAFNESFLYIIDAINSEQWQLITKDYKTPIKYKPEMPLTTLQLRFLKTLSLDPRLQIFADGIPGIGDDIKPIYFPKDFHYFDIIKDGDPYDKKEYIDSFRLILHAIKVNKNIIIKYENRNGKEVSKRYKPIKIEYSIKDDKFRLLCGNRNDINIINIGRIIECRILEGHNETGKNNLKRKKKIIVIEITDERNALERSLLHFAHFEKITTRINDNEYQMKLSYNKEDETEVLIRVLSFGPMLKVTGPTNFINLIKKRLDKQKKLQTN